MALADRSQRPRRPSHGGVALVASLWLATWAAAAPAPEGAGPPRRPVAGTFRVAGSEVPAAGTGASAAGSAATDPADSLLAWITAGLDQADWAAAARAAGQLVAMRRAGGDSARRQLATALTYLSLAERNLGQFESAEGAAREVVAIARAEYGSSHSTFATALNNLAGVLRERGELVAAEALYRRSLLIRLQSYGEAHASVAASYNNLATVLQQQGDLVEAERMLRDALASTRAGQGDAHPNVALALQNLAAVLRRQAKLSEAEDCFRQAERIVEARYGRDNVRTTYALQGLADLLASTGKTGEADTLLRACLALREGALGSDHVETAQTRDRLGVLQSQLGRPKQAEALHEQALRAVREAFGAAHPRTAATWAWLGGARLRQGDAPRAAQALASAAAAFEQARVRAASGLRRATVDLASPYPLLAASQLLCGDGEAAWQSCERSQGRVLAELLAAARPSGLPAGLRAQRDSLAQQVARLEGELLRLLDAPDSARVAAAEAAAERRELLLDAQAALAALHERIAADHPAREGRTVASSAVRAALAPDDAVMGWLDAEDPAGAVGRWAWVLRASRPLQWFVLPLPPLQADPDRTPERQLREALRARAGGALGSSAGAIPIELAHAVFEARVAPLLPVLEGVRRVIVVPSGGMLGVPLEALVDSTGRPLLERFAVSYAPSASLQLELTRPRTGTGDARAAGRALLVGDPPFRLEHLEQMREPDPPSPDSAAPRGGGVDEAAGTEPAPRTSSHESLSRLPRLRWSRREIEAVATAFDAPRVLVGADASEPRLDALVRDGTLAGFRVLHFATHALADLQRPEDCALVLAQTDLPDPVEALGHGEFAFDGLITAREIVAGWQLSADLVTLSACETALGRATAGEGYLGLAHALLQAGSRCVLVSLWAVDDRATALLMERFYRAVGDEGTAAPLPTLSAALREAKLWLRSYQDASGRRPFEHPRYWAGFVLVGADA